MKYIVLLSFLGSTLTAPWQIPHPLQSIIKQQMFQPSQETIQHVTLLEQLQRIQQQIAMQAEMQMQQQRVQQQIPLLLPLQGTVQQQRLALQEQMFALQQFQELQRMNYGPPTLSMNSPPILVLFPNIEPETQQTDYKTNRVKLQKLEETGDDDSEIIDAELTEESNVKKNSMRAILLMPNTRGFVGDFISSVPFLPIEINVPDIISWMYNGIAGIISGIGQSLPFRPQMQNGETQNEKNNNMKSNSIKNKWNQQMPIVVIPLGF